MVCVRDESSALQKWGKSLKFSIYSFPAGDESELVEVPANGDLFTELVSDLVPVGVRSLHREHNVDAAGKPRLHQFMDVAIAVQYVEFTSTFIPQKSQENVGHLWN